MFDIPRDGKNVGNTEAGVPILRLESPSRFFPNGIDPAMPLLAGQLREGGVATNVLDDTIQVLGIADDAVVAFLLPEFPVSADGGVDLFGGDTLQGTEQVFQLVSVERTNHGVAVIGHDDRAGKLITLAVEMLESLMQNVGPAFVAKVARAVTFIKPRFSAANDLASVVFPIFFRAWFGVCELPMRSQVVEFGEFDFGKGIGLTKRDEVGRSVLPPVRQMPRVNANVLVRVQPTKPRW